MSAPMGLRRHIVTGAICESGAWCDFTHHRPRHRRTGPQNTESTAYIGKHRRPVGAS